MAFDQGQFDFGTNGSGDGYRLWRERLEAERRQFESRWGVIVGRKVRVQLRDHAKAVEGILELRVPAGRGGKKAPVLRLGSLEFCPSEIESVVAVERPSERA